MKPGIPNRLLPCLIDTGDLDVKAYLIFPAALALSDFGGSREVRYRHSHRARPQTRRRPAASHRSRLPAFPLYGSIKTDLRSRLSSPRMLQVRYSNRS